MSTAPPPKNGGALVCAPKPRSAAAAWARVVVVFIAVDFSVRFSPLGETLWTTLLPHVVVAPLVALFLLSLEVLGLFSSSRSCGRLFPLVPSLCAQLVCWYMALSARPLAGLPLTGVPADAHGRGLLPRAATARATALREGARSARAPQWARAPADGCATVDHPANPLILPHFGEWIIADPTIFIAADGRWSLFASSTGGTHWYVSDDGGNAWRYVDTVIRVRGWAFGPEQAVRPYAYHDKATDTLHLYYEKFKFRLEPFGHVGPSSVIASKRLPARCFTAVGATEAECIGPERWSDGPVAVSASLPWETEKAPLMMNPFVFHDGTQYVLFYTAGQVWLPDTKNDEPKYVGRATAPSLDGPWTKMAEPAFAPNPADPWANFSVCSFKVVDGDGGGPYVGLSQAGYILPNGTTGIALQRWESDDGVNWRLGCGGAPVLAPTLRTNDWKAAYIFGFDTVRASDDEVTIYYNARSGYFPGVETVGASRLRVGRRGRAE